MHLWYDLSTSSSCLNSISHSPIVLTTRPYGKRYGSKIRPKESLRHSLISYVYNRKRAAFKDEDVGLKLETYVFRVNVRSRESIGRSEKRTYVYLVGVRSRIKTYFCGWNLRSKGIKRIRCVKVQYLAVILPCLC